MLADPLDEAACRILMRARQRAGEPSAALAAYERLRTLLADELGVDPAPETRGVHVAILRERELEISPPGGVGVAPAPLVEDTLAGREPEMAVLAGAWSAAAGGRAALFTVTGEAGIGKTRLTEELAALAEATGGEVLRARCYEAERSLARPGPPPNPVPPARTSAARRSPAPASRCSSNTRPPARSP